MTTTTNDLAGLSWAGLMAFLFRDYGGGAFKVFLREVNEDRRYGDLLTVERQQEIGTFKELEEMGLSAVAETMRENLPHLWEVPCPYQEITRQAIKDEWKANAEAKRKAFYAKNTPPAS